VANAAAGPDVGFGALDLGEDLRRERLAGRSEIERFGDEVTFRSSDRGVHEDQDSTRRSGEENAEARPGSPCSRLLAAVRAAAYGGAQERTMDTPAPLTVEDGLFELPGREPTWIWAHTCPTPNCACRTALIVSTPRGREALLERARVVDEARRAGAGYVDVASQMEGVEVFHLDIDTVEAFTSTSDAPLVLAEHPEVRAVVERLDGEVLDELGRLWYRGKGKPDPVTKSRAAKQFVVRGWMPGELVAHDEALVGVRADVYPIDGRMYEAIDLYCVVPGCNCGEVTIDVPTVMPEDGPHLGCVVVERSGAVRIEPQENGGERLRQVWDAFQKRHPRYRERLARREAVMKEVGMRLVPEVPPRAEAKPRVGRNDPCPCGSGKKHKKCCGAA
jgi:hypothetical protein